MSRRGPGMEFAIDPTRIKFPAMTGAHALLSSPLRCMLAPLMLLSACDNGGNSSPPPPTPAANTAPNFTSPDDITLVENSVVAYQAVAVDLEGDPITYSIAGGVDADAFTITPAGILSFITPPNYDLKTDHGKVGAFFLTLRASDGKANRDMPIRIVITNSREGIAVKRVATGFDEPNYLTPVPGDPARLLVVEKGGRIWYFDPVTGAKTLLITIPNVANGHNYGLTGMAPRPDFATSGVLFIYMYNVQRPIEIYEVRTNSVPARFRRLAFIPSAAVSTTGGWMGFGPDGYLYSLVGSSGGSQDPNSQLGKVLRFKIDMTDTSSTPFEPAPGNPYIAGGGNPYVFASGLANPYRGSFYGNTLLFGDVGVNNLFDEINMLPLDRPGLNFGAGLIEGFSGSVPAGTTLPVTGFDITAQRTLPGEGIVGGYVYRGPVTPLSGQYIFGNYKKTKIMSVPAAALVFGSVYPQTRIEDRSVDFTPDVGTIDGLMSFGEDSAGNLYLLDSDGDIFMVTAA